MARSDDAMEAVAALTGSKPVSHRRVGGGDTSAAFALDLDDGTTVFAKAAPPTMPGAIAAEAASLRWLADAGAVPVPAVRGSDDSWLVLEHLPAARPSPVAADEFGRRLAQLHAAGAPAHGAPPENGPTDAWIGLAPMRNQPESSWPEFYARHRIEPYLRRAVDAGMLDTGQAKIIDSVRDSIEQLAGPEEPPSRLHGDLWSGNVHWADSVRLIDPAAHGGHRETDLAMLDLFGCPHLDRIIAAYQEVTPLSPGWERRTGLHQLFPLLVHTVLFGHGYAAQSVAAARSALRLG